MSQLSTKFKIILIVFAVIIGLYAIQFFVTAYSNTSKRESFENDEDDEMPNDKPAPKQKAPAKKQKADPEPEPSKPAAKEKESIIDKEVKLNVLEQVESIFDKMYPNSDKKPMVFDMLMNKEHFEELKEKYENGESLTKYIKNVVRNTMTSIEGSKIDTFEEDGFDKALNNLEKSETRQRLVTQLDDIVTKITELQDEIKKLQTQADADEKKGAVKEKFSESSKPKKLIEGFENRINYASY